MESQSAPFKSKFFKITHFAYDEEQIKKAIEDIERMKGLFEKSLEKHNQRTKEIINNNQEDFVSNSEQRQDSKKEQDIERQEKNIEHKNEDNKEQNQKQEQDIQGLEILDNIKELDRERENQEERIDYLEDRTCYTDDAMNKLLEKQNLFMEKIERRLSELVEILGEMSYSMDNKREG